MSFAYANDNHVLRDIRSDSNKLHNEPTVIPQAMLRCEKEMIHFHIVRPGKCSQHEKPSPDGRYRDSKQ